MRKTTLIGSLVLVLGLTLVAVPVSAQEGRGERREERREEGRMSPKPMMRNASGTPNRMEKKNERSTSSASTLDVGCLKTAIDKRDAALTTNWSTLSTSVTAAITARSTNVKAALDKPAGTERQTALKAARKTFTDATKSARKTFMSNERTVHSTFKTEAKTCGARGNEASDAGTSEDGALVK